MRDIVGSLWGILIGLLLLGAVVAVGVRAMNNNKISNALTDITQIQASIQTVYGQAGSYGTLTNAVALNVPNLVPDDWNVAGAITDQWSGAVTLVVDPNTASRFDITLGNLPAEACVKLATSVKALLVTLPTGGAQSMPVDPGTAATDCAAGGNVTFVFGS